MHTKKIESYATLLVEIGLNVQKGQIVVIASPIECAPFARLVTEKAYEAGAKEVVLRWRDELSDKIRFEKVDEEVLDEVPDWLVNCLEGYDQQGAAFLNIAASDPELMKSVDPKRIARQNKARSLALKAHSDRLMSNKNAWCVASVPTDAWAQKVFPNLDKKEAFEALWDSILKSVRADLPNPVQAWKDHQMSLDKRIDFLHKHQFKSLRYKNEKGTDVVVDLPENHQWFGGGDTMPEGYAFVANMPTEEVFTLPHARGVNGKIFSSMPLNYNGNLIDNFSFTFSKGEVVDFDAEVGKETLEELLQTDDGAKRLGEVALVPNDSPISNQGILFYNTLFDENASCHFALGKAYPTCIKGGEDMDTDILFELGGNDSLIHVDFMVGTADLEITGITHSGEEIPVFKKGNFAFE